MTREEAVSNLKMILEEVTETDEAVCYVTSDDAEALILAIKSLEKQIPKTPVDNIEQEWFECPTCGKVVVTYYDGKRHHCRCGQSLKWEDIDDIRRSC